MSTRVGPNAGRAGRWMRNFLNAKLQNLHADSASARSIVALGQTQTAPLDCGRARLLPSRYAEGSAGASPDRKNAHGSIGASPARTREFVFRCGDTRRKIRRRWLFQPGFQHAVQLADVNATVDHVAAVVDQDHRRQREDAHFVRRSGYPVRPARKVAARGEGCSTDSLSSGSRVGVEAHADDREALRRVFGLQPFSAARSTVARLAPGGPIVDQHVLAFQLARSTYSPSVLRPASSIDLPTESKRRIAPAAFLAAGVRIEIARRSGDTTAWPCHPVRRIPGRCRIATSRRPCRDSSDAGRRMFRDSASHVGLDLRETRGSGACRANAYSAESSRNSTYAARSPSAGLFSSFVLERLEPFGPLGIRADWTAALIVSAIWRIHWARSLSEDLGRSTARKSRPVRRSASLAPPATRPW